MRYAGNLHKVATSRLVRDAAALLRNLTTGAAFAAELEQRAQQLAQEAKDARERCGDFHRVGCSCDVLERIGEPPAR